MLAASGASAAVSAAAVPLIEGALALAEDGIVPGGTQRNVAYVEPVVTYDDAVPGSRRVLLADAQTSGGLLVCCPPARLPALRSALAERGTAAAEIGVVEDGPAGTVRVS
jgi:selenide,water dikinase